MWLEGPFIAYKWHGHFRVPRIVFGRHVEQTASGRGGKWYRTPEILFLIHCTIFRFFGLCPGCVNTEFFEVTCWTRKWTMRTRKAFLRTTHFSPSKPPIFIGALELDKVFEISMIEILSAIWSSYRKLGGNTLRKGVIQKITSMNKLISEFIISL